MVVELIIRFVIGGLIVCAFALLGDTLRPKSFAGIFGAAPSVALATLGLTYITKGPSISSLEGRSMMAGAAGLILYSILASWLLLRHMNQIAAAALAMIGWFAVAFGIWGVALR
ncbi:MAG TPA: DUF3147 family protein [Chloroflexota bacterium]|nr:DUF3147 family protein [Chloroflexota bacterium]